MGCICATATDEYHGWRCSITDGACMFLRPNQDIIKQYIQSQGKKNGKQSN